MGRLPRLAPGLLVACLVLGVGEAALRLTLGPPPPPVKVWIGQTGRDHYLDFVDGTVSAPYQPDSRTPPFPAVAAGPRVVFVGASSVMGGDVGHEARFSTLVGQALSVEAVNLAAPAMDSHDIARLVDELDAVTTSAVVYYEGHNDFGNAYFQERYRGAWGLGNARAREALEHLQVYVRLRLLLAPPARRPVGAMRAPLVGAPGGPHPPPGAAPGPAPMPLSVPARPPLGGGASDYALTEAERATIAAHFAANVRLAHWRLARRGIPLVLMTPASSMFVAPTTEGCLPGEAPLEGSVDCPRQLWERGMALRTSDPATSARLLERARDLDAASVRAPHHAADAIRALATELGAPLVDTERALPRDAYLDAPAERLFRDQLHFSPEGHAAVAALLVPTLGEVLGPYR